MGLGEVVADRLSAGVVAHRLELSTELDDPIDDFGRRLLRTRARSSRARLKRLVSASPEAGQELVDPAAMHPVRSRQLANRTSLQHMRLDQTPGLVHRKTPSRWCLPCPDTCVAYVVAPHTSH